MLGIDEKFILLLQCFRWDPLTRVLSVFLQLDVWLWFAVAIALSYILLFGTLRVPVLSMLLARILSGYAYSYLQILFHRPRPYSTIEEVSPLLTASGFSFPSGQATVAMASAVVLAHHFPKARILIYILAVLAGFSPVYFGIHYGTDVLAGFLLGIAVGWLSIFLERALLALTTGINLRSGYSVEAVE